MKTALKHESLEFIPLEANLEMDREQKILYGVQVAMLGPAKGHGFDMDETTLEQIVTLGNAAPKGVKVRFGHPTECSPALGTFLGVRKNFRLDGKYVRADLHMSDAARPEYAEHVLSMAELHPEMIGNSVVVSGDMIRLRDEAGDIKKDKSGDPLPKVFRVKHLHAVDVVDEPASGDGMFAEPIEGVNLSPRTIAELREALDKPGFLERAMSVLTGRNRDDATTDADPEVSKKEDAMSDLTLKDFKAKHPEVAKEYADELSTKHSEEIAAAEKRGAEQERERTTKILKRAKPHHFAATKDYPHGFVAHALEKELSYAEALEGLMDLDAKAGALSLLETESGDIPVEAAEPEDKPLSEKEVRRSALLKATAELKKGES